MPDVETATVTIARNDDRDGLPRRARPGSPSRTLNSSGDVVAIVAIEVAHGGDNRAGDPLPEGSEEDEATIAEPAAVRKTRRTAEAD